MASTPAMFTASRTQTITYLLAVCPFSIAFLVFVNSSVSFVVTDLIGIHDGEGDAVGTLGFADELLALVACPLWGVLSDRIGVRHVSFPIRSTKPTLADDRCIGLHGWLFYYSTLAGSLCAGHECLSAASAGKITL